MLTQAGDMKNKEEARVEAAKRIGGLLLEHAGKLWVDEDWHMDVTDDRGLILFVITVSAMQSAAVAEPPQTPS